MLRLGNTTHVFIISLSIASSVFAFEHENSFHFQYAVSEFRTFAGIEFCTFNTPDDDVVAMHRISVLNLGSKVFSVVEYPQSIGALLGVWPKAPR